LLSGKELIFHCFVHIECFGTEHGRHDIYSRSEVLYGNDEAARSDVLTALLLRIQVFWDVSSS